MNNIAGDRTSLPWPKDEIARIVAADDLHVSPLREDAATYGTPSWIWSVAVGDALYVRAKSVPLVSSCSGAKGGTNRRRRPGKGRRIRPVDGPHLDNEAFRAKYRESRYLESMIGNRARAATMEIRPRRLAGNSQDGRDR
jgi:hypothetical protein